MSYAIEFKYRFELLIPLVDNKGDPFPSSKIEWVGDNLLKRYDSRLQAGHRRADCFRWSVAIPRHQLG